MDLNALVRDVSAAQRGKWQEEGISCDLSLSEGPLPLHGDPSLLNQVLQNVLQNARTAMAKSPQKTLRVATRADGEHAVLEVSDSGKGITPENLGRVFEPFFTTKDVWSNVGLGLSVAYRVVSEHEGKIDVASEVGKGTQVVIRLPRGAKAVRTTSNPALPASKSALERQT